MTTKKEPGFFSRFFFRQILTFLVLLLLVFLFWPGNDYVRTALLHGRPKIDQYRIFENRVVKAGNPHPWEYVKGKSKIQLSSQHEEEFKKYETVAFAVIQHGKVVYENYWDDYSDQSLSNSFSMAKSIVSLLVGCAIEDGYISSVDAKVSAFLPMYGEFEGRELRVRDLLTMSAGMDWDESTTSLFSTTTEAYYGKDLWNLIQRTRQTARPGEEFKYQSGVTQILAYLLEEAVPYTLSEYASLRLWTPIEAEEDALWSLDHKDGIEKAYCCFNSNVLDFARLGQLVLNHGKWKGIEVMDSAYIAQATTPASYLKYRLKDGSVVPCEFYGFQFWHLKYRDMDVNYFRGILGQYIFVIPELDAVIVRLGHKRDKNYDIAQDYTLDVNVWLDAGLSLLEQVAE